MNKIIKFYNWGRSQDDGTEFVFYIITALFWTFVILSIVFSTVAVFATGNAIPLFISLTPVIVLLWSLWRSFEKEQNE